MFGARPTKAAAPRLTLLNRLEVRACARARGSLHRRPRAEPRLAAGQALPDQHEKHYIDEAFNSVREPIKTEQLEEALEVYLRHANAYVVRKILDDYLLPQNYTFPRHILEAARGSDVAAIFHDRGII